jgi:hypothetical protein
MSYYHYSSWSENYKLIKDYKLLPCHTRQRRATTGTTTMIMTIVGYWWTISRKITWEVNRLQLWLIGHGGFQVWYLLLIWMVVWKPSRVLVVSGYSIPLLYTGLDGRLIDSNCDWLGMVDSKFGMYICFGWCRGSCGVCLEAVAYARRVWLLCSCDSDLK